MGLYAAGVTPTHIVFRGTASEDSVRCDWRGVARTLDQREKAIRFWLGKDDDDPLPTAAETETEFMSYINGMSPRYQEFVAATYLAIARGGLSTDRLTLTCYADYSADEYLLGAGPNKLTVAYDLVSEARSYDPYRRSHAAGEFGPATSTPLMTEAEYESAHDRLVWEIESTLVQILEGTGSIVFLAPMGAHNAIAIEVWQVVAQWDLQTDDQGTVNAVRYGVPQYDPEHTQTLANLKSRITATSATSTATRIASVSGLTQYYRDIGAYDDITPDDGDTTTFTPSQPPPVPTCAGVDAVSDPRLNPGLVRDCSILLDSMDTLAGTASLDWNSSTSVTDWDGVTTSGTPSRITELELDDEDLDGTIPPALGGLSGLVTLDLSDNDLTGEIPEDLERLWSLQTLRLSGNSFIGCIPMALEDVPTNDLSSLGLPECVEGRPAPAPEGVSVTLSAGTFTITWSAVAGSARYEAQQRIGTTGDNWESVGTTTAATLTFTPSGGPACGTTYQFRVRAFGDGIMHTADWGAESDAESVATEACNIAPQFVAAPYSFSIAENATTTALVGTVSATDDDSDTVMYTITNGNSDGKFSLGDLSGEVTVADVLDYETISSYTLTVEASDGRGGTATTTVAISVSDVAEDPPPAPSGLSVSLADGAFTISWTALAGAARYEVQHREKGSGDDWTVEGTSTSGSLTFTPEDAPDCGTTHEFRMRAFGDGETYVATWGAESASESVATEECDRAPRFGSTHYSFSIAEDAATSTSVGTVSATDEDGDTLTYEIAVGNEDGKFSIGSSTGGITLAGEVDSDVLAFYSLRVEADDGNGNTATTTVGVSLLLSECSNGTIVPRPRSNPHLVRDCSMLLAGRDTLAGTGSLDWSANTRINDWQGVTVHPTPSPYVRVLLLTEQGLTGSISPELGGVADVRRIDLDYNTLSGGIPRELGSLPDLELLYLTDNQLTGSIPPEMGNLRSLKTLYLSYNNLTGALPSELGRLRRLTQLTIEDNSLTRAIPPELGDLSNLRSLYLSANMLTGGIPPELGKLSKLIHLVLERNSLGGEIPSQLGALTRLEHVYLRNNGLTGAIPAEWGELANLTRLYLSSGNNLTGCIPSGLRDVEDNDLDRLGLEYCGSSGQ